MLPSTTIAGVTKSTTETYYGSPFALKDQSGKPITAIAVELDVTAAATDAGDALDVAIQASLDGTNYVDVIAFTQCVGNGGAKRYFAKIAAATAVTMFENGTALTAGNIRDLWGSLIRVKYAVTNDSDSTVDTSFTFSVSAVLL